jgi:hypothetical protein
MSEDYLKSDCITYNSHFLTFILKLTMKMGNQLNKIPDVLNPKHTSPVFRGPDCNKHFDLMSIVYFA